MKNRPTLRAPTFLPLPLAAIQPRGWLRDQLRIQADGLSGQLDTFWRDIKDSRWFGGNTEGWERAPYWLDGVVPLAFLLDDAALKAKVTRYVDYILTHQHDDGWLGPKEMVAHASAPAEARYDLWGQLLATKVLAQWHDATGDARALTALERALRKIDRHIDTAPLFNWGQFRWFEGLIAIFYLYENVGAASPPRKSAQSKSNRGGDAAPTNKQWLLDLAVKLHAQGFNWRAFFERWPLTAPTEKGRWNYAGHVVNNAMALKAPALWWRISGDERDRRAPREMMALLDKFHGTPAGIFTGDECLAGTSPIQGTELCAVVEYMYSLELLLSICGDPAFGDRLEQIAFNALPATFSPDMWSHQYDQQINQVECSVRKEFPWNTNGPEANIFGVEPNYGCCTANLSQGFPKFAAHLWMGMEDENRSPRRKEGDSASSRRQLQGLAAVAYAPCEVTAQIGGARVTITEETNYPFGGEITFRIAINKDGGAGVPPVHFNKGQKGRLSHQSASFSLLLRIPAWASGAKVSVKRADGTALHRSAATPDTFHRLTRQWKDGDTVTLSLPMRVRTTRGHDRLLSVHRGPLLFGLQIGEQWKKLRGDEPHADWEIFPTTPWNYGLVSPNKFSVETKPIGKIPFANESAPVRIKTKARRISNWKMEKQSAAPIAVGPHKSNAPIEDITLVPYGNTRLRIAAFPLAK